jgi:hypothetical protein
VNARRVLAALAERGPGCPSCGEDGFRVEASPVGILLVCLNGCPGDRIRRALGLEWSDLQDSEAA